MCLEPLLLCLWAVKSDTKINCDMPTLQRCKRKVCKFQSLLGPLNNYIDVKRWQKKKYKQRDRRDDFC